MARIWLRSRMKRLQATFLKLASDELYDRHVNSAFERVTALWNDYIDRNFADINYTGASRRAIVIHRPSPREWEIREESENLQRIREGTPPTGRFDPKVYEWALKKVLGVPEAINAERGSPTHLSARRAARRITFSVARHGTSAYYAKHKFPLGHPGYDYVGHFMAIHGDEVAEMISDSYLAIAQEMQGNLVLRGGPANG